MTNVIRMRRKGFHLAPSCTINGTCKGIAPNGDQVLASASTLDESLRKGNTGNVEAAGKVGTLIAERAKAAGVTDVAFDRSGYKYHGRVKALAEAAREGGLQF